MLDDIKSIRDVIDLYFKGTYQGDVAKLKRAFYPQARISGMVNEELYDWTLAEFIARVTARPTAENKGEIYSKEILFLDQMNDTAVVKARVVVGSFIFIDYITLLKIKGEWSIRHKSFTVENSLL